jgi:hypothetical protein
MLCSSRGRGPFLPREQLAVQLLLDRLAPRHQDRGHVIDVGFLDVRQVGLREVAQLVGRQPEHPGDLEHLKLPRLEELGFLRRDGGLGPLHPFQSTMNLWALSAPACMALISRRNSSALHPCRLVRRLEVTAGRDAVVEERRPERLGVLAQPIVCAISRAGLSTRTARHIRTRRGEAPCTAGGSSRPAAGNRAACPGSAGSAPPSGRAEYSPLTCPPLNSISA